MSAKIKWVISSIVILIILFFCFNHIADFSLDHSHISQVSFYSGKQKISGTLITPKNVQSPPIALIVHGDGPQDRFAHSGYLPFINQLLDAGIGVYSWDKPGIGKSSGNWLSLSMSDRAKEVLAALKKIRSLPDINPRKVGLLGFSQAGWVIPLVADQTSPAFSVIIGGAVNWRRQGAYYTYQRLKQQGLSESIINKRVQQELQANDRIFNYPATANPNQRPDMTPERFYFALRNYHADASAALETMKGPLLALWGSEDRNVNPVWNSNRYRLLLTKRPNTEIKIIPKATHGLLNANRFNYQLTSDWPLWKKGLFLFWGHKSYAHGVWTLISHWIQKTTSSTDGQTSRDSF
ncbi:MAG: hypothetical protein CENE_01404 [Candidatus Celerinatantimonas neptuna]|nr:MAG: hypothetical protein CENE_01404 [Candidatus Celerinatantimonas neptuna]